YMEKHSVSRLVGSPPGYIGYDEGGQLTEAVRRKPYSVVLLDEIEKAHPDVFNILLQILEDGKLTDAQGRKVDFRNTIVIMTSNIGAASISKHQSLGFTLGDESGLSYEDMKSRVMGELKKVFRPELLNRIDEIIVFHKLSKEEIKTIVDLVLRRLREQMATHEATIELTDEAKDLLVENGYDPAMGARPLRRAIQRFIEAPVAPPRTQRPPFRTFIWAGVGFDCVFYAWAAIVLGLVAVVIPVPDLSAVVAGLYAAIAVYLTIHMGSSAGARRRALVGFAAGS